MQCPLDYSLCRQTVTVYRLQEDRVVRQVLTNVLYRYWIREKLGREGRYRETGCLLIVPGAADLRPGDRVLPGEGPRITRAEWTGFLPVRIPGLAQIAYVKPYFWENRLCHTEAGRQ